MSNSKGLHQFASIFRCSPEMAPVYVARIHERMGHEVPMDNILAAMKKIAPKKLSMDTIIDRLQKMESSPVRKRVAKPVDDGMDIGLEDNSGEAAAARPGGSRKSKEEAAPRKPSTLGQIEKMLTANWERGRKHGLKPPAMSADQFVKSAQSIAGMPKPTVARVFQAIIKINKRDVLLTPNLVADEINEAAQA